MSGSVAKNVILLSEIQENTLVFNQTSPHFSLENFEGPLELLLYLIQKDEMDVCEVAIKTLTEQFMEVLEAEPEVDTSSEVLALTATLLLMKSQRLIPQEEGEAFEEEEDPRVEIIQNLIEYCRFKEVAKTLSLKEEQQQAHFPRATSLFRKELGTGLEKVDIEDLKVLLMDVIARSDQNPKQVIKDEEWHISHKIDWFRNMPAKLPFFSIFSEEKCRQELIVFFLALLELMKLQELVVVKEEEKIYIIRDEPRT